MIRPLLFAFLVVSAAPSMAASLRVSPIRLDVGASANSSITLLNNEPRPINAQVRVFRWSQIGGQDQLTPTEDVIASPPIVTIPAQQEYVVRLQRTLPSEVASEEAYRIVVDELPNPNRQRNGTIALVLRYVIPAFFFSPDVTQPRLKWSVMERAGHPILVAENSGDKHIQLSDLVIKSGSSTIPVAKGLAGYVLGHETKEWLLPGGRNRISGGVLIGASDVGPVHVPLQR